MYHYLQIRGGEGRRPRVMLGSFPSVFTRNIALMFVRHYFLPFFVPESLKMTIWTVTIVACLRAVTAVRQGGGGAVFRCSTTHLTTPVDASNLCFGSACIRRQQQFCGPALRSLNPEASRPVFLFVHDESCLIERPCCSGLRCA